MEFCLNLFQLYTGDDVDLKTMPKGRLITPKEGCGFSKVLNKRIIGGAPAKNGKQHIKIIRRFYCIFKTLSIEIQELGRGWHCLVTES